MRTRLSLVVVAVAIAAVVALSSTASAQIRKATRGEKFPLSPAYGPWMVMVASFSAPPPGERVEGMTPEQAADELVFELRSNGIPAYTFALDSKVETLETVDRLGEPDKRIFASQWGSVCVLAGNYKSIDASMSNHDVSARQSAVTARETLKWIKEFRPQFLTGGKADGVGLVSLENGGNYRITPGQQGPLSGAFFSTNPLRSADDIRSQSPERLDLLTKLNVGSDCSLYENKAKYTLIVASFYGSSVTLGAKGANADKFDRSMVENNSLYQAGQDAWELARYMRQLKFDAYVWHDQYKSVVTVGSFDTTDDPRIATAVATYSAKTKAHAETKAPVLTAEFLTLPFKPTANDPVQKRWIFDPEPRLMKVPKRK
ncbi:MAG: hypothetical protein H0T47_12705 [Planctomycetaceae bacterium]|nr:hypothetical protein [Planctomycetaceae bacterium]